MQSGSQRLRAYGPAKRGEESESRRSFCMQGEREDSQTDKNEEYESCQDLKRDTLRVEEEEE